MIVLALNPKPLNPKPPIVPMSCEAQVFHQDSSGRTALHHAAAAGDAHMVEVGRVLEFNLADSGFWC